MKTTNRLGLDIGGTKVEAVLFDEQGTIIWRQRYATCKSSYPAFLQSIRTIIQEAASHAPGPVSIGIGLPGTPDPQTNLIKNSNIQVINQQPFAADIAELLGKFVAVANDANCFALSEAIDGNGAGHHVVFGVILGTGCGGGVVVGQHLLTGPNACCGEWGHNPLPHYNPQKDGIISPCYCGQHNCLETFISGSGLERQYHQNYSKQGKVPDIISLVRANDTAAIRCWDNYLDQVARALAGVVNLLDPDIIVIGGGVSNIAELYPSLQQRMAEYIFGKRCCTPLIAAKYGDSSGVRGAAWLGQRQMAQSFQRNKEDANEHHSTSGH
ncbi:ROK family protein [Buttiauxella warmboldiae]|uniref:ROK family protein n=1 Tax=Buttiauxella warmboldiae TaxID=82993 RepID=A0A3N5EEG7_9ENTR|nr:ROK family protein [Buttiauxella warmboldiae]RPH29522.1 ROK family protein [Buttiauxella warmboldiae]